MNALNKVPSSLDPFAPREGAIRPTEEPLDQGVMLFDIVITPRTAEAKLRLERAMLWDRDTVRGCAAVPGWLNAQIVAAIEGAEDEMWIDAATGDLVDDDGETIEPNSKTAVTSRQYVVLVDEETETKYRTAAESTGIPIEELIAGAAAEKNRTNDFTETELDPEVVMWLIEASANVRMEKRKAGIA